VKAISVVTVHEYLRGIFYLYVDTPKLLDKLKRAEAELRAFEIIPYTYEVAYKAAEVDAMLVKKGRVLSFPDVAIAATALHHNLILVTRNVKHFQDIPGLKVESY